MINLEARAKLIFDIFMTYIPLIQFFFQWPNSIPGLA